jgi:hypothetical protein
VIGALRVNCAAIIRPRAVAAALSSLMKNKDLAARHQSPLARRPDTV